VLRGRHHAMHRAAACVAAAAAARRAVRRQPTGPRYDANARPRRARARALQLAPYPRAAAAYYSCTLHAHNSACTARMQPNDTIAALICGGCNAQSDRDRATPKSVVGTGQCYPPPRVMEW
jgi:hypothetical protein